MWIIVILLTVIIFHVHYQLYRYEPHQFYFLFFNFYLLVFVIFCVQCVSVIVSWFKFHLLFPYVREVDHSTWASRIHVWSILSKSFVSICKHNNRICKYTLLELSTQHFTSTNLTETVRSLLSQHLNKPNFSKLFVSICKHNIRFCK